MTNVKEWIEEYNPEALLADGFDEAVIGVCERFGMDIVVAYDRDKCIEILIDDFLRNQEEDDTEEDLYLMAEEYFEYNVIGAYVGETTPVFITRLP
jgi:hypothetical protein|tara:strand:+ start:122 stop:409 length:288 start_codon:yes stop_codon:yes gene_type:complete